MSNNVKTTKIKAWGLLLVCSAALCACKPQEDLQGNDPLEYYDQHPVKNKVQSQNVSRELKFADGSVQLDDTQVAKLTNALRKVSPMATEGVIVQTPKAEGVNEDRRHNIIAVLRSMGYEKKQISFEPSASLAGNHVKVDVQYAVVIPPEHCPDWRRSPVTTYSNTKQGNWACATETNLGAMVADPHDLVRGSSHGGPDTERNGRVVSNYHGAQATGTASASAPSSGASAGASASSGLPDGGGK